MRLFDKITASVFAVMCILAVSCAKDNPMKDTIKAKSYNYFEASASASDVDADGGQIVLEVNANVPWKLTLDKDLTADVSEGDESATVIIDVPENFSFSPRNFAYSVSTEEELDVDDPQQWTEFGRKLDFSIAQPGVQAKFSVDTDSLSVNSMVVSATFTLTENVGYEVTCITEGLTCKVTDDPQNPDKRYLKFSFPSNASDSPVLYRAVISPESQPSGQIAPISIVIRQAAYKLLVIDFTTVGASTFKYDNGGEVSNLPRRSDPCIASGTDFWAASYPDYLFNGAVRFWSTGGGCLNFLKDTYVRFPRIAGYKLLKITDFKVLHSAGRNYKITSAPADTYAKGTPVAGGEEQVLASGDASLASFILTDEYDADKDYYIVCNNEAGIRFKLTYVSVE